MILTRKKDSDLFILSNLDDKTLFNFCISNPKDEYLKKLCADESFWMNRLKNNFPDFKLENKNKSRTWKQTYLALVYYSNKYFPDKRLRKLSKGGMKNIDLIQFFIQKGANKWNWGMYGAARGGHKDLVQFFIENGANNWNRGMYFAARGGHKDLVDFFIEKDADEWNLGMEGAARGGHRGLVDFFIEKGANEWNFGMIYAARGGQRDLVQFFIEKGAKEWKWGMHGAAEGGHKDLVDFFQQKLKND